MDDVRTFFEEYAAASMGADAKAIARRYAPDFIVSGRDGSAAFKNDERFLAWLESVFARNREVGMTSLEVASVHSTPLGDDHALVTVEWVTTFEKTGAEEIRFHI